VEKTDEGAKRVPAPNDPRVRTSPRVLVVASRGESDPQQHLRLESTLLGGPFADRSGGLITFEVGSATDAERLVAHDPFVREILQERRWVKEWMTD
jgi:anti-sigma factor ChrR (cupin superfamily)